MTAQALRLFLFAGQSNIAGADAVIEGGPAGFIQQDADKHTLFTYGPGPGDERSPEYVPWGEIKGHVVKSGANPKGFVIGPEVGFCRELYTANRADKIAIIKCCGNIEPGTQDWLWSHGHSFFTAMMKFVEARVSELKDLGYQPVIAGVIWDQGIDDGFNEPRARNHGSNLRAFIQALRIHFANPALPLVLSRSVCSPLARRHLMEAVRKAQLQVARATDNVAWINVDDLATVYSHHLSAASQLEAGRRFGDAFRKLTATKKPSRLANILSALLRR